MAEVYAAKALRPHGFEKNVAVKRILPEFSSRPGCEQRLIAEARLAVTLSHANIVSVFDCGRFGDSLCVVMELVDGLDLSSMLYELRVRDRPMPIDLALYVATELLQGLDFAHARGVIHRDVSPSNILVSKAGEVKLADFGIAQAIGEGAPQPSTKRIAGKWRFMSPEQTRGAVLDARSDLFSAGAVLFEIFTGRQLFVGKDAQAIVRKVRSMQIPSASSLRRDLPAELDALLASALEREPQRRSERAAVLVRGLAAIARAHSLHATARDLVPLVEELSPTEIMEVPPCDVRSPAGPIDEVLLSGLSRRRPPSDDWNTEETTGSITRRLSEEDGEAPPRDDEPPNGS